MKIRISTLGILIAAVLTLGVALAVANAIYTVNSVQTIGDTWREYDTVEAEKAEHLNQISKALGFGGMIHHFKDYTIFQDRRNVVRVFGDIRKARVAIIAYRDLGVNAAEDAALNDLWGVIDEYETATGVAEAFARFVSSAKEIHTDIDIDDGPAKQALETLSEQLLAARREAAESVYGSVRLLTGVSTYGAIALGTVQAIFVIFVAWVTIGWIARPVNRLTLSMNALAKGDKSVEIPLTSRRDELGEMAQAVEVFKENALKVDRLQAEQEESRKRTAAERRRAMDALAKQLEQSVGNVIEAVSGAATQMQTDARSMSQAMETTAEQATNVAGITEEASTNVQTVAAATEELSASVAEIARQVGTAAQMAGHGADVARQTDETVRQLESAAEKISAVVGIIEQIAAETHMLALNATIESARAGEAGKGFAVVANEVKQLATQTTKATSEISEQVQAVQGAARQAVAAIEEIGQSITEVSDIANAISAGVSEQESATHEIARNVAQAATGTDNVATNISIVSEAANANLSTANQVQLAAEELSRQADSLRSEVETFLAGIRREADDA